MKARLSNPENAVSIVNIYQRLNEKPINFPTINVLERMQKDKWLKWKLSSNYLLFVFSLCLSKYILKSMC